MVSKQLDSWYKDKIFFNKIDLLLRHNVLALFVPRNMHTEGGDKETQRDTVPKFYTNAIFSFTEYFQITQ